MPERKIYAALAAILMLSAAPAVAEDQHQQHHPGAAPPAQTAPNTAPGSASASMPGGQGAAASGMPGMPMMGMGREGGMQGMPMMGMMRQMMGEGGMMGGMPMGSMPMMAGRAEGRIAFLKAELKITEAQLPLWNAVADAIRANAQTGAGMMDGLTSAGKLPDRLAAREKTMNAQLEALRKFKGVVEPLYAALSDEQKKTADELLMSPMGMM